MFIDNLFSLLNSWALWLVSLFAFLLYGRYLLAISKNFRSAQDPTVIKLELTRRKACFIAILETWMESKGSGALRYFRRQLWYDNLWAIFYAIFLSSSIALLITKLHIPFNPGTQFLLVLPLLAGLLDIFPENTSYLWLLRGKNSVAQLETLSPTLIFIGFASACLKFALLIMTLLGVIILLLYEIIIVVPPLLLTYLDNWLLVLISFMVVLLYAFKLFPESSKQYRKPGDPQMFALQLAFTKPRFVNVLKIWHQSMGVNAIPAFCKSLRQLDFLFPIAYATFFASIFVTIGNFQGQDLDLTMQLLLSAPILAGLFDWAENLLHLKILKGVNSWLAIVSVKPTSIFLASIMALFKWILIIISFLGLCMLLGFMLFA